MMNQQTDNSTMNELHSDEREWEPEMGRIRQILKPCHEIDTDEFTDDKFNCRCPRCGFKFDV